MTEQMNRKTGRCRRLARALAAASLGLAVSAGAALAWEPTEPIEIMVHSKPGSSPDVLARFIQHIWQKDGLVNVPVTINNQPVISVGFAWLNQHEGNPHKLTVSSTSTVVAPLMGTSDVPWQDLTPISLLISEYIVLGVAPDSELKTAQDFIDSLKKNPKSLSIGFGGSRGNPNNTAVALAAMKAGVDIANLKFVIYSSGAEARIGVMGGHVDAVSNAASGLVGPMVDKTLRIIAVSAPERLTAPFQDVPTWREIGLDVVDSNWRWIGGPGGLTDEQIAFWEDVVAKTVQTPEWKEMVESNHATTTYLNHQDTLKFFEEQEQSMTAVLQSLDLLKK